MKLIASLPLRAHLSGRECCPNTSPMGRSTAAPLNCCRHGLPEPCPLPAANLADALHIDTAFWIQHGDALERRFNSWAPAICRQQIDEDDDDYFYQPVCQGARRETCASALDSRARAPLASRAMGARYNRERLP